MMFTPVLHRNYLLMLLFAAGAFCAPIQPQTERLTVPEPFIFMSGWSDNIGRVPLFFWTNDQYQSAWRRLLPSLNVVIGTTADATFVHELRRNGKLFAVNVHAPLQSGSGAFTAEHLATVWSAPFRNVLGGKLPEGFDAICIDEFGYPDGSVRSKLDITALQRLRKDYPNKLIFVYGALPMGEPAKRVYLGFKPNTYNDELQAINAYADLLIMENYQLSSHPEKLSLFDSIPDDLEHSSPGLAAKTVYALYINQVGGQSADDGPGTNFLDFLKGEVDLASQTAARQKLWGGFGFWIMYRARPETIEEIIGMLGVKGAGRNH